MAALPPQLLLLFAFCGAAAFATRCVSKARRAFLKRAKKEKDDGPSERGPEGNDDVSRRSSGESEGHEPLLGSRTSARSPPPINIQSPFGHYEPPAPVIETDMSDALQLELSIQETIASLLFGEGPRSEDAASPWSLSALVSLPTASDVEQSIRAEVAEAAHTLTGGPMSARSWEPRQTPTPDPPMEKTITVVSEQVLALPKANCRWERPEGRAGALVGDSRGLKSCPSPVMHHCQAAANLDKEVVVVLAPVDVTTTEKGSSLTSRKGESDKDAAAADKDLQKRQKLGFAVGKEEAAHSESPRLQHHRIGGKDSLLAWWDDMGKLAAHSALVPGIMTGPPGGDKGALQNVVESPAGSRNDDDSCDWHDFDHEWQDSSGDMWDFAFQDFEGSPDMQHALASLEEPGSQVEDDGAVAVIGEGLSTIESLADECFAAIIAHVGAGKSRGVAFSEKLKLAAVCRRWRWQVQASLSSICLEGPKDVCLNPRAPSRHAAPPPPEEYIWDWPEPGSWAPPRELPALQRTVGTPFCHALPRFPAVCELEIRHCQVAGWDGLLVGLGTWLRNLTSLILSHAPAAPTWENLGDRQLVALSEWCPALETLVLEHCLPSSLKTLPASFLPALTRLSTLRIVGARGLSFLPPCTFSHPSLLRLQLSRLPSLNTLPEIVAPKPRPPTMTMTMTTNAEMDDDIKVNNNNNSIASVSNCHVSNMDSRTPPPGTPPLRELRLESLGKALALVIPSPVLVHLASLRKLAVIACPTLPSLPILPPSLEELLLDNCHGLHSLSGLGTGHSSLHSVVLRDLPALAEVPLWIGTLPNLRHLRLVLCRQLVDQVTLKPNGIGSESKLRDLIAESCSLRYLPRCLGQLRFLQCLRWRKCNLAFLPTAIGELSLLRILDIGDNPLVLSLPSSLALLSCLERLSVDGCTGLRNVPEGLLRLPALRSVNIKGCTHLAAGGGVPMVRSLMIQNVRVRGL